MALGDVINTSTLTTTFDDEFNTFTSSANGSVGLWRTTLLNGDRTLGSNGEQEYYSDSSVGVNPFSLSNGVLDIQAAPGTNALGLPYTSGVITTENSFNQLYGYFEIDAKMPAGQGLWPAFWLLPASGAWPPELDAFEVLGNNPTTLYFSTHSSVQATQGTTLNVANVSSGFNLYGVMWGPKTVDLYINNVEVATMPTPADMNVPMYMLANLAVGGYWPGDPNSSTVFPANMLIDYVRAYAYPGTTGGTVYDTTAAQNIGAAPLAPVTTLPATAQAVSNVTTSLAGVSVASNWPGGYFTIVLSDTSGLLQTTATTDVFTSGEGTSSVTLTGNLAPLNAALATMTYTGSANEWIWVSATDPQGLKSSAHIVVTPGSGGTGTVVTTPTGTAPVVTAPASLAASSGAVAALGGISVADSSGSASISVTVSDSSGLLNTAAATGVTAKGEASTTLTLTGNLAAVNADLASLTYMASSATGMDWVWVSANDPNGTQGLGHVVVNVASATTTTPPVTTTAPMVTAQAALTLAVGSTQALGGISVADSSGSASISVTVSDSSGLLNTAAATGVTAKGEASTTLTLTGNLAAVNADLASLTYMAGSATGMDWVWVSANDPNGTQGLGHVVVNVAPAANTPPVVTAQAALTLASGSTQALGGVSVADSAASVSVTVSDSTGLLATSTLAGVTAQGEGSTALKLTGSVAAVNAELAGLTYTAGTAGTDWLWISANDPNGTQGLGHTVITVAANAPPVVTTPATATLAAGVARALTGVHVSDNGLTGNVAVAVSDSTGLLNAAATGVTVQGEGTTDLTLTGSLAAVNADLASLTYTAHGGASSDLLWVSANNPNGVQGIGHVAVSITPSASASATAAPCFCAGTLIATAQGQVAVEELRIGDLVKTATRGLQPIKWIGTRAYEGHFISGKRHILPVCIKRDALGENIPSRDLYVSPDHAICEGGVLVHAWRLINGVTITQLSEVEHLAYYHVELERHSIIFAEDCPTESFLDEACRARFHNADSAPVSVPQPPCLPRVADGFYLQRIQERLRQRAGVNAPQVLGALRGCIDESGPELLRGWVQDTAAPDEAVALHVLAGGKTFGTCLANVYREDLREAGLGAGCHGFAFTLPPGLRGPVTIQRVADGARLAA